MKHDLEKTTTHGRVSSVEYTFWYSSFTDIVTLEAKWKNLNENERFSVPCEKIDELIDFLQEAKAMFNLGKPTAELFPGTLDELGGISE